MILKSYYKEATPVGVYVMNNFGGLVILDILSDESVIAAWHYGEGYKGIRRHQVYYTYTGRAYIRKAGSRFYLDQIVRVS